MFQPERKFAQQVECHSAYYSVTVTPVVASDAKCQSCLMHASFESATTVYSCCTCTQAQTCPLAQT